MEKKLYTIGKVAKLMGMQSQLLRHYCDIGLITPEYVDPQTGYRYFSFEQLPESVRRYVERIEELAGVRISMVSVGPDRRATIVR